MERREALITGVVLAVASALITVLVVIARAPGEAVPQADAPDPPEPPAPTVDNEDPPASELAAFVAEAIAFVETTRAGSFVTEPDVVALNDADFVARLDAEMEEDFASDPLGLEGDNAFYRATGLIGPDESIEEIYRRFGAAGVLGYYDPITDELVVRQVDELSLLTKTTIVHELTHAYDDQRFDLDRPEYFDRDDELAWTFRATAEGSASWVEAQWEAGLSRAEQDALLQEELGFGDLSLFAEFELSFLILEYSVYDYGSLFVEHLVDRGGTAALDEAFEEPAATSEQVMLPRRYDEHELALQLDPPPADGEVAYQGAGGQVLIDALFQGSFVFRDVEWGGDQMSVWVDGDRSCLRWDLQSDSPSGLADLRDGFVEWTSAVGGDVSDIDDVTIRVDRCA